MARLSRKQKATRLTVSIIEAVDPDSSFEICDPTARNLRSWQPVAGFTQYKEFIQAARAKGQKHREIIKSLGDIGVHIKLHQLKYLLDRWGISNRNTTKAQRAYIREIERIRGEEGGPDVDYLLRGEKLVRPSQKALIVRNRRAEASECISSSGIRVVKPMQRDDFVHSNEVEANDIHPEHGITSPTDADGECNICHQENEIKEQLPRISPGFPESLSANPSSPVLANEEVSHDSLGVIVPGLARSFEAVSMQMRKFSLEKPSLADHPDKWSDYYYPHLAQWLSIRREFAQWVINKANQECRPDECVAQCHDRIMWTSRIPTIPGRYMGHLPLGILESFLHHEPRLDLKNALDELNDWRILENIFLKNFQNILKVVLPAQGERNSRLWFDFRTQIVHFLKMKNLFGPNHYLVIQTMFAIAGVLEQIDTLNAEDLIFFPNCCSRKCKVWV
ncbi:hypothetical protein H072_6852 [Dactylellina haptotyla CBS 200.50]|uniref:Clr5 domain-containing protein n=1 Tax=Dactylellina haptotyla (strain CBS 200.50) TaxID=1284197 RepID=S8BVR0_DACHA|nr:hypothetical protein H072_6852 [Dactylellina haptotyla CBS 200.50]